MAAFDYPDSDHPDKSALEPKEHPFTGSIHVSHFKFLSGLSQDQIPPTV